MVGNKRIASTSKFEHGDELNPTWDEHFRIELANETDDIAFVLKGDVLGPDKVIGQLHFDVEDVMNNPDHPEEWRLLPIEGGYAPQKLPDGSYQLVNKHGRLVKDATLNLTLKFASVQSQKQSTDLLDSYFPMREGCNVTLYQDACTPQTDLHDCIVMSDGSTYQATNAYRDIYEAIMNAKHFVYITGWSVWSNLVLVRGEDGIPDITLGELLKQRANDGVTVLGIAIVLSFFLLYSQPNKIDG